MNGCPFLGYDTSGNLHQCEKEACKFWIDDDYNGCVIIRIFHELEALPHE